MHPNLPACYIGIVLALLYSTLAGAMMSHAPHEPHTRPLAKHGSDSDKNLQDIYSQHQAAEAQHTHSAHQYTQADQQLRSARNRRAWTIETTRTHPLSSGMHEYAARETEQLSAEVKRLGPVRQAKLAEAKKDGVKLAQVHDGFQKHQEHHEEMMDKGWGVPEQGFKLSDRIYPWHGDDYVNTRDHMYGIPEARVPRSYR